MLRSASAPAGAAAATSTSSPVRFIRTPALAYVRSVPTTQQPFGVASSSKCRLPNSARSFRTGEILRGGRSGGRRDRPSTTEAESTESEAASSSRRRPPNTEADRKPLNPVFTNSKASLRPLPNVRSPIFSKRPIIDSAGRIRSGSRFARDDPPDSQALLFSRERDERLRILYSALGSSENVKLTTLVNICSDIADHMEKKGLEPSYIPYNALFEQLSTRGMHDECWELMDDMQAAGLPPTLVVLNYILKAAVDVGNYDSIEKICRMINDLDPAQALPYHTYDQASTPNEQSEVQAIRAAKDEAWSTSSRSRFIRAQYTPEELPSGIYINVRNFNTMTYAQLFRHALEDKKVDYALMLFSALIQTKPTAVAAFQTHLRSAGAEYLLQLLCRNHEYRLATEIADWLHVEGLNRLVMPKTWMFLARACAVGDYYPGLKLGWERIVANDLVVPDEGFLLTALATAARRPDSALCLEILNCLLSFPSKRSESAEMKDAAPPLQHIHLVPLLEALAAEGRYREMIRLAGAMAHWGVELDGQSFGQLYMRASKNPEELAKAISDWQRVIDEGLLEEQQQQQGSATPSKTTGRKQAQIITRVVRGEIPSLRGAVETHTMNTLIQAAAELGESEEALNIWEERRYVKSRAPPLHVSSTQEHNSGQSRGPNSITDHRMAGNPRGEYYPIQPSIDTFNALLLATINRTPAGTVLAESIFKELKEKFPSIKPDALTFERMIAVYLVPSGRAPHEEDGPRTNFALLTMHTRNAPQPVLSHINSAFEKLEECKEHGVTPTRLTYDILIRASLKREEDIRWIDLTREMVREAGYLIPLALSEFIRAAERSRRMKGRLRAYEQVWETYVKYNVAEASVEERSESESRNAVDAVVE